MPSNKPSCLKGITTFSLFPGTFFLALQTKPSLTIPIFTLIVVQIVIVFLPALFNAISLSAQGVAGICIVVTILLSVKVILSASFIYSIGRLSVGGPKWPSFRYCLSAAAMTQWIIVSGKILASLVGMLLVISQPQRQFEIPSFLSIGHLFRWTGGGVPVFFSGVDIFVVWYVVVLTRIFQAVMKMRLPISVMSAAVNWTLMTMLQKALLSLITSPFTE